MARRLRLGFVALAAGWIVTMLALGVTGSHGDVRGLIAGAWAMLAVVATVGSLRAAVWSTLPVALLANLFGMCQCVEGSRTGGAVAILSLLTLVVAPALQLLDRARARRDRRGADLPSAYLP